MSEFTERVIDALKQNNRVLSPTIQGLMAEAWDEGFKQGGPMHDEHYGEPDKHKINPYRATPLTASRSWFSSSRSSRRSF